MRCLLLALLAALSVAAAGCGSGTPTSFANCRQSSSRGSGDPVGVLSGTFDCLADAYRSKCRPAQARIGYFGVDTGANYDVRIYRRDGRCAGDVRVVGFFMGRRSKPESFGCRQAYLFGKTLTLFQCGRLQDVALRRALDCSVVRELFYRRACRRAKIDCPVHRPPKPSLIAC
jgi:hypothetical protein